MNRPLFSQMIFLSMAISTTNVYVAEPLGFFELNAPSILRNRLYRSQTGFSLIELLMVMAIMGLLASIAYPNYQRYMTQTCRSDGEAALLDLANRMERFYGDNQTYRRATIATAHETDLINSALTPEKAYILSITEATDTRYALKATPSGAQALTDLNCQSLTFNSIGVKGISTGPSGPPKGTVDQCW